MRSCERKASGAKLAAGFAGAAAAGLLPRANALAWGRLGAWPGYA